MTWSIQSGSIKLNILLPNQTELNLDRTRLILYIFFLISYINMPLYQWLLSVSLYKLSSISFNH